MRIGVVTTSYPRWPGDPAGSFVGAHVDAMRALGHHVDVIAAGDGAGRIPSALFYGAGAPDELERGGSVVAALAFTARQTIAVARRARAWDLAIAHWLAPSALACLPVRAPLLAIAHGGDVHTLRRTHLLGPALLALHARGAQLAFVSEELRAIARATVAGAADRWLDAALVQPMGLDVARFAAVAAARAPAAAQPPVILVVSRLVPVKGIDVVLAAIPHLRTAARVVIAGDGPERARLETIGGAELLGGVEPTRRDELLRTAAVVVVPSRVLPNGRSEGMPMIALEALASGVPVVASAVGGLRELTAATLVPPDDPRALAAAIDRTLAAPADPGRLRASVADLDWRLVAARLLAHAGR